MKIKYKAKLLQALEEIRNYSDSVVYSDYIEAEVVLLDEYIRKMQPADFRIKDKESGKYFIKTKYSYYVHWQLPKRKGKFGRRFTALRNIKQAATTITYTAKDENINLKNCVVITTWADGTEEEQPLLDVIQ